jgi:hypothetical protein
MDITQPFLAALVIAIKKGMTQHHVETLKAGNTTLLTSKQQG